MQKINGPSLLGFTEFFTPTDVVGATKLNLRKSLIAPGKTPTKTGKPGSYVVKKNPTVQNHGKVLSTARTIAAKAVKAAAGALRAASKKPPATHVGVVARATTPKQKQAVAKAQAATAKAHALAQKAGAAGVSTKKAAIELAKHAKNQKALADRMRGKGGATRVRGNVEIGYDQLEQYYDMVGADPDMNNPGFLTDGTTDPAYATPDSAAADAGLDLGLSPGDTATALPPPPAMSEPVPDLTVVGGIMYNGEHGTPDGYVGSYRLFTRETDIPSAPGSSPGIDGSAHYGYVWGQYNDTGPEKGIPWGDENTVSGKWNHIHGRHWLIHRLPVEQVDFPAAMGSIQNENPNHVSYGPLVGNPAMPAFAGMRVDSAGRMGWYPQEAPDWLTAPLKQAAALTAQAAQKAAAEAAAADAAIAAKAAADQAAAQAAQDAANALAESQEVSAANVAQSQQETQAQQMMVDQAKADQAAQMMQAQQGQQVNDMMLQQAQRQQAYMAQHPEMEFGQPQPQPQRQQRGGSGQYRQEAQQDQGQGDEGQDQGQDDGGGEYEPDHRGGYMGQPDDGQGGEGDYEDQQ